MVKKTIFVKIPDIKTTEDLEKASGRDITNWAKKRIVERKYGGEFIAGTQVIDGQPTIFTTPKTRKKHIEHEKIHIERELSNKTLQGYSSSKKSYEEEERIVEKIRKERKKNQGGNKDFFKNQTKLEKAKGKTLTQKVKLEKAQLSARKFEAKQEEKRKQKYAKFHKKVSKLLKQKITSRKILKPSQMTMTIKKREQEPYQPIYIKEFIENEKRSMFFS